MLSYSGGKHFAVFELIMDNIYGKWVPNMITYEAPPERDVLSFLYVIGCIFLWDIGIQRVAYAKEKKKQGEKIRIGNIYNYCWCHKIFQEICKDNLQGQCSDQYWKTLNTTLTCDFDVPDVGLLYRHVTVKSYTCIYHIYHEAVRLYMEYLYGDYFAPTFDLETPPSSELNFILFLRLWTKLILTSRQHASHI